MNKGSSRSQSLFVITIFQRNIITGSTKTGKIHFVDLAGSEKMSKRGIEKGKLLKEAQNINKSLMTLGMVINALSENAKFVPYRDSKLTRVLQESIGGNSQTTLIITVTSNGSNQSESLSTLRFGQRAKLIKNKVVANTVKSVKELMIKIKELEEKIKKLESAKGKIDENDLKDSNDGNTITTHLRTKTDEDEICPNCEKYKTELMNKRVELITLNENIEDLTREKEDLEIEVKEKCNEIFNLNEKIFLSEAKDKLIMDDEAKLFDEISIKLETFTFFNQKKQKYLEDIKTLVNNNIKEQNIKKINNYLNEILSIIHLDSKNYKELLNLISNNSDSENSSTHFASHSGGNLNNKIDEDFKIHEKKNSDNTNDSFSKSKHSSLMRSKNSIKINNNNSFEILNKDHEEINAYKDLLSENDTLKNLNENYQLEKYQNEILIKKLNDQIKDFNKKISDKEEIIKDLNGKLCDVIQQFDEYKNQNILDFSTKEQKTIELINKISDLEDQNFKLIHFSKDSYKKKYSLMDKQIKQFTLQVQQLLTENNELKKKYERKLIESNNLQIKVDELQNKLSDIVKGTIIKDRFTYNMTTQSDLDMSFTNRSVCIPDPNNNNGKGYIMQNMNDLLKQNLQRDNKRNYNNNPFNQAYKNKKNINISNMINNRIIKIITGGNKQQ
jgi:kinesin family protein 5